jgi:hypothetical protein
MADFENKQIDKRVVLRYLRKGIVDEREYERHLKGLDDRADDAMPVEAALDGDYVDDDLDDDDEA